MKKLIILFLLMSSCLVGMAAGNGPYPNGGGSSGGSVTNLPSTTNLLKGNGIGGASDTGISSPSSGVLAANTLQFTNMIGTVPLTNLPPGVVTNLGLVVLYHTNGTQNLYSGTNDWSNGSALGTAISNSVSGETITVSAGSYYMTNRQTWIPPGVNVKADSHAKIYSALSSFGVSVFVIQNNSTWDGGYIFFTNTAQNAAIFYLSNFNNSTIKNVSTRTYFDTLYDVGGTLSNSVIDTCRFIGSFDNFNCLSVVSNANNWLEVRNTYSLADGTLDGGSQINSRALCVAGCPTWAFSSRFETRNNGAAEQCVVAGTPVSYPGGGVTPVHLVGCTVVASANGSATETLNSSGQICGIIYVDGTEIISGTNWGTVSTYFNFNQSPLYAGLFTNGTSLSPNLNFTNLTSSGSDTSAANGSFITNFINCYTNASSSGLRYVSSDAAWEMTNSSGLLLADNPTLLGTYNPDTGSTGPTIVQGTNGFTTNYIANLSLDNGALVNTCTNGWSGNGAGLSNVVALAVTGTLTNSITGSASIVAAAGVTAGSLSSSVTNTGPIAFGSNIVAYASISSTGLVLSVIGSVSTNTFIIKTNGDAYVSGKFTSVGTASFPSSLTGIFGNQIANFPSGNTANEAVRGDSQNGAAINDTSGVWMTGSGIMAAGGTVTATNGFYLPPIASYSGIICTNGGSAYWNSNGFTFHRSSLVGGTTWLDTLQP